MKLPNKYIKFRNKLSKDYGCIAFPSIVGIIALIWIIINFVK